MLCIFGIIFTQKVNAQDFELQSKIIASERTSWDYFSNYNSVSIDGDYAVVGASGFDAVGYTDCGAALVYKWNKSICTWEEISIIYAESAIGVSDKHDFDNFGSAVSISGNKIAISAVNYDVDTLNSGMVYIYSIEPLDVIEFQERIEPLNNDLTADVDPSSLFGRSLELNGIQLIIGKQNENHNESGADYKESAGAAYIYQYDGSSYVFEQKIVNPDRDDYDHFGYSVSIFGNYLAVGAPDEDEDESYANTFSSAGSAYVYQKIAGVWTFIQKLVIPFPHRKTIDKFGYDIEITQSHIIVSAPDEDHDANETIASDSTNSGSVYIYKYDGPLYSLEQKIVASDRHSHDRFGRSIDMSGNKIIVGADFSDLDEDGLFPMDNTGAAYIYNYTGIGPTPWDQVQKIIHDDRFNGDHFGRGVAMSNSHILIADTYEDEDEVDDPLSTVFQAGSAFIYKMPQFPKIMSVESNLNPICSNIPVTLTVDGHLNDAIAWTWYEDSCDGTLLGEGENMVVTPSTTTTYCVRAEGCIDLDSSECHCIEVEVKDGHWHQSTIGGHRDNGNDVITDADGNVYTTGQYYDDTFFPGGDHTGVALDDLSPSGSVKTFISKYDNCGNLMWVAHTKYVSPGDDNYGTGIVLNESSQRVYVVGNFNNTVQFYGGIGDFGGGGIFTAVSAPGNRGYVACLDMDDGSIKSVDRVMISNYTYINAIAINELDGKIYIGGEYGFASSSDKVFVQRYTPTLSGIGLMNWQINDAFYTTDKKLNDLDFDETLGAIWMTGNFKGNLSLNYGAPALNAPTNDAFVARYIDGAVPSGAIAKRGNITGEMYGEGITVDDIGNAYLTGRYKGGTPNMFTIGLSLPAFSTESAYFLGVSPAIGVHWPAPGYAEPAAQGLAAQFDGGIAYFTGTYSNNITFNDLTTLPYVFAPCPTVKPHTFVVAYNAAVPSTLWRNGTTAPSSCTNSFSIPGDIATDPYGNAFVVGTYSGNMGYISGIPASGDLTFPGYNTYTMRVHLPSGQLKSKPSTESSDDSVLPAIEETDPQNINISLVPNPAEDLATIVLNNFRAKGQYRLQLISIDGKLIYDQSLKHQKTPLDLSGIESGIYIVSISDTKSVSTIKLIKED